MYLDKPMRDHTLLQAIARVNRPYEDEEGLVKPCGFILDFVGVFEDLKKALAFDSEDVEDIEKVVREIGQLKGRFTRLMEEGRSQYLTLVEVNSVIRQWKVCWSTSKMRRKEKSFRCSTKNFPAFTK